MASTSHVTIRKRVAFLFLFFIIVIVGLIGRLGYLQFFRSSWLTENAIDQRIREIPVEARRGFVFDRVGREMAVSVSSESVYAIPAEIRDAEGTAAKLAAILALDAFFYLYGKKASYYYMRLLPQEGFPTEALRVFCGGLRYFRFYSAGLSIR